MACAGLGAGIGDGSEVGSGQRETRTKLTPVRRRLGRHVGDDAAAHGVAVAVVQGRQRVPRRPGRGRRLLASRVVVVHDDVTGAGEGVARREGGPVSQLRFGSTETLSAVVARGPLAICGQGPGRDIYNNTHTHTHTHIPSPGAAAGNAPGLDVGGTPTPDLAWRAGRGGSRQTDAGKAFCSAAAEGVVTSGWAVADGPGEMRPAPAGYALHAHGTASSYCSMAARDRLDGVRPRGPAAPLICVAVRCVSACLSSCLLLRPYMTITPVCTEYIRSIYNDICVRCSGQHHHHHQQTASGRKLQQPVVCAHTGNTQRGV